MAGGSVDKDEVKGTTGWHKQLDDELTWVWHSGRTSAKPRSWKPALHQQITDFHARYERACIED